jgi:hypothetical protein
VKRAHILAFVAVVAFAFGYFLGEQNPATQVGPADQTTHVQAATERLIGTRLHADIEKLAGITLQADTKRSLATPLRSDTERFLHTTLRSETDRLLGVRPKPAQALRERPEPQVK